MGRNSNAHFNCLVTPSPEDVTKDANKAGRQGGEKSKHTEDVVEEGGVLMFLYPNLQVTTRFYSLFGQDQSLLTISHFYSGLERLILLKHNQ